MVPVRFVASKDVAATAAEVELVEEEKVEVGLRGVRSTRRSSSRLPSGFRARSRRPRRPTPTLPASAPQVPHRDYRRPPCPAPQQAEADRAAYVHGVRSRRRPMCRGGVFSAACHRRRLLARNSPRWEWMWKITGGSYRVGAGSGVRVRDALCVHERPSGLPALPRVAVAAAAYSRTARLRNSRRRDPLRP